METRGRDPHLLRISSAPAPGACERGSAAASLAEFTGRGCLESIKATELHSVGLQVRPTLTHLLLFSRNFSD